MNRIQIREELEQLKISSTELVLRVQTITDKMDKIVDSMIAEYGDIDNVPETELDLVADFREAMNIISELL